MQFLLVLLGNSAAQRGPLWWAAHHRHHHRFSDTPQDTHSPSQKGFWDAHWLWWSRRKNVATRTELVPDLAKYPELMFLDRFDSIVPLAMGALLFPIGMALNHYFPGLGTNGLQLFVWGFVISTVVLFHGVATINSLSHVFGSRRFQTTDTSRNNWFLAIITLGEGWHNNHHHYCNSTRQGFFWWEIDITYYGLKMLEKLGLVWDLKPVPARMLRPQPAHESGPSPRRGARTGSGESGQDPHRRHASGSGFAVGPDPQPQPGPAQFLKASVQGTQRPQVWRRIKVLKRRGFRGVFRFGPVFL